MTSVPDAGAARRVPVAATLAVLLLISGVWTYKTVVRPDPFWAFLAGDGEIVFFYNALAFAVGALPGSAFHPGTPVQAFGAMVIRVLGIHVDGVQPFLRVVHAVGFVATLAAVVGVARGMLRGVPFRLALVALLTYWVHPASWLYLTQWGSYLFHLPLGVLVFWTLAEALEGLAANDVRALVRAGLVAGLACAVQLVFLPFVLGGLAAIAVTAFAAPAAERPAPVGVPYARLVAILWVAVGVAQMRRYHRALDATGTVVWLFMGASLILAVVTLGVRWWRPGLGAGRAAAALGAAFTFGGGVVFAWQAGTFMMLDAVWRRYSGGTLYDNRLADVATENIGTNIAALVERAPYWLEVTAVLIALVVATLWKEWRRGPADASRARNLGFGGAILITIVLGIVLPLNYGDFRAGVPGLGLRYTLPSGVAGLFAATWLVRMVADGRHAVGRGSVALAGLLLAGMVAGQIALDVEWHRRGIQAAVGEREAIDNAIRRVERELGRPPRVAIYEVMHPDWAVRWGSINADRTFDFALDAVFPSVRELKIPLVLDELAVWPRQGGRVDVIVGREAALGADSLPALRALGPVERIAGTTANPILVVRVSPAR